MRYYAVLCFLLGLLPSLAAAETCGLYQIEDFGDHVVHALVDLQTCPERQVQSVILNVDATWVQAMIGGMCYCVRGPTEPDPRFEGDSSFRILQVEQVTHGPYVGCNPPAAASRGRRLCRKSSAVL